MTAGIEVRPVASRRERRAFLTFPWRIYRGDPLWVPPLLPARAAAIDPARGDFFRSGGAAELFIAWRGGEPAGTICCAEDRSANAARAWGDCTIGFFECVDDLAVARALFDRAAAWAAHRRLDALYGPFNLDREDSYGVLIEGRDRPPVILCGHTPPYYPRFFEEYGFEQARGDNLAFAIDADPGAAPVQRLARLADRVRARGRYRVRSADLAHWDEEIDRVHGLINRALAHLPDFTPWERGTLQAMLAPFRDIVDPELVLFAETAGGETVGWLPGIPNLNEALIGVNGLRYPWNTLQLLFRLRYPSGFPRGRRPRCLAIKSVLVPPEHWDTGAAVLLFDEMARRATAKGYRWADLSLTSDDNPRTPVLAAHMGAREYKRYRVYRKWLASPGSAEHQLGPR